MTVEILEVDLNQDPVVETTPVVAGIRGPAGPAGPALARFDVPFVALATWSAIHNLGYRPMVQLLDDTGRPFVCGSIHVDGQQVIVSLGSARSGRLILT